MVKYYNMCYKNKKRLNIFQKIYLTEDTYKYLKKNIAKQSLILISEYLLGSNKGKIYSHFMSQKLTDTIHNIKNMNEFFESYYIDNSKYSEIWGKCNYYYVNLDYTNFYFIKEFIYLMRIITIRKNKSYIQPIILRNIIRISKYFDLLSLQTKEKDINLYSELYRELELFKLKYYYEYNYYHLF
tara:strand:- start:232 stop:783 length:552 start_codon:yes stop_codon:yes gene_type:complete